ncbi:MAG: hypothetical protein CVU56_29665 [Deltaproteobacteria bacterium HGW-Deltaproteobacteria-14]|jgi:two-component system nitrogen regulation response regulator GlnG/two-component system response regulator HydG|nr:MAG: hypothetical protein CVU56_29665 [Deltaproteobacteria bacterium HGW-Deltaproteobacteria-14]
MTADTTEEVSRTFAPGGRGSDLGLALAVVWCRDEPTRAGELLWVGPHDRRVHVFGRGDEAPAAPDHVRAHLVRQRPGQTLRAEPLLAKRLSREQLHIRRLADDRLTLDNRGRRALLLRGVETTHAVVGAGDVVMIEGQLLLLCVTRPAVLPPLMHANHGAMHEFGAADAAGLVGESPPIWALRDAIDLVVRDDGHALVYGPSGVGKEVVARALHAASARGSRPLVARDVASIPEELVGIELFGHEGPGEEGTPGLVEQAEGATLLLDDLGGAAGPLASHLGRLMDRGEFHRAGDPRPRRADVRIVATLCDEPQTLPVALRARFRHALRVPGLAERREDIPLLVRDLLRTGLADHPDLRARFADADGEPRVAPGFLRELVEDPPDGGVRALDARLWRGIVAAPGEWIIAPPHPKDLQGEAAPGAGDLGASEPDDGSSAAGATAQDPDDASLSAPTEGATAAGRVIPAPVWDGAGRGPLDPRLAPPGLPASVSAGLPTLTRAERIVLQHVALNQTSREIAKRLFVSVRTVQNHRARICDKLGLRGNNRLLGVAIELARYLGPPEEG